MWRRCRRACGARSAGGVGNGAPVLYDQGSATMKSTERDFSLANLGLVGHRVHASSCAWLTVVLRLSKSCQNLYLFSFAQRCTGKKHPFNIARSFSTSATFEESPALALLFLARASVSPALGFWAPQFLMVADHARVFRLIPAPNLLFYKQKMNMNCLSTPLCSWSL